jgi:uncharacterized repeat protein (TIGR01451 family)
VGALLATIAIGSLLTVGVPTVAFADPVDPTAPPETSLPSETPESDDPTQPEMPAETPAPGGTETPAPGDGDDEQVPPDAASLRSAQGDGVSALSLVNSRPTPPSGHTVVKVAKGGVRQANSTISGLGGAQFAAYQATGNNGNTVGAAVNGAVCETDENGVCYLVVPNNSGYGYWIQETTVPAGWDGLTAIGTGNYESNKTATPYRFRTGAVSGTNSTKNIPADAASPNTQVVGTWANAQENPAFPTRCGIDIAIVVDRSTSINRDEMQQFRAAVQAFVGNDGLNGTPSRAAVYTFSTNASKLVGLRAMGTAALNTAVTNATSGSGDGYTNWDSAMRLVANDSEKYDAVLFLTDGDPTAYVSGNSNPTNTNVQFRMVEEAAFSANAVKQKGSSIGVRTKIVGVGIDMTNNSDLNLKAISGPILNEDYYLADNFEVLTDKLKDIATKSCGGTITVQKQVVDAGGTVQPAGDVAGWEFKAAGGTVTNDRTQSTNATGFVNYALDFSNPATQTVMITETQKPGYDLRQQSGKNAVCTVGGQTRNVTNSGDLGFKVDAKVTEIVSCTVQNVELPKAATVEVNKQWVIDGTSYPVNQFPTGFSAGPSLAPQGDGGVTWNAAIGGFTQGQMVTVSEKNVKVPELCTLTGTAFAKNTGGDISTDGVVNALALGANEYTVTNTATCDAELTLVKTVINDNGGTAVAADWAGRLKAGGNAYDSGQTKTVTAGNYALTEDQLPGYQLTGIQCVGGSFDENTDTITLTGQQSAECTFTNNDIAPTLKLVKNVAGSDVAPANWTLRAEGTDGSVVTGDGVAGPTPVRAGETFDLTEVAKQYGGEFTNGSWTCDSKILAQGSDGSATTLTKIALDQHVTCTITNTAKPGLVTHEKTVTDVAARADGSWDVRYTITVTNASAVNASSYDLTDAFQFGPDVNITPGSASAILDGSPIAGWNGESMTELASDEPIAKGATHTYVIAVNVFLDAAAGSSSLSCDATTPNKAFNNKATLNGQVDRFACAEPALPTITKEPGTASAVPGEPGQWDVTYAITVANAASEQVYFDLTDTPTLPAGTTLVSDPTITPVGSTPAGLIDVPLPADTTYQYTVTLRVLVSADATTTALECGPNGHGVKNVGTIVSSNQTRTDDACVSIPVADITHDKTVFSAAQQADGRWTVVYEIVVTNESAVAGVYSLSDETAFGAGISYADEDASVTGPGASATWNGQGENAIVANATLAADADATYTVTIQNVDVAAGAIGSESGACPAGGSTDDGAFNNVSTLRVAGTDTTDQACAEPTRPAIAKDFVTSTQVDGDGTWNVNYTITVDNSFTGSQDAYYALTDTTAFAAGVEVNAWTVTGPNVAIDGPFDDGVIIPADGQQMIAAGAQHVFTVVFNVDVPAGIVDTQCTQSPGSGFFNTAGLTSGNDTVTDDACGPITDGGVPSVAKSVTSTTQAEDGSWTIVYDLVVTGNPDYTTRYSLTDTLDFGDGITVTEASWSGASNGTWSNVGDTATLATDRTIGTAPAIHTYTVTVVATVAEGAFQDDPTQLVCVADQPQGEGTGFLNRAVLTSGEADAQHVEACSEPATPTIAKVVSAGPTQDGDDWTIEYEVTVTNSSDEQALVYSLTDAPAFGAGAEITSATATRGGSPVAGWNGVANTTLAEHEMLDGGASHTYVITVDFTVAETDDVSEFTCEPRTPGNGLFNGAAVTSGNDTYDAEACADVPVSVELDKVWVLNGEAFPLADAPAWLQDAAVPTLDGAERVWGTEYATYAAGDEVLIGENLVDVLPSGCTLGDASGLGAVELTSSYNMFTVTNPIDCEANLSMLKEHISSTMQANGTWNLVYTITVDNDSPVIDLVYDLDDTLEYFGEGITVNEALWSGPTSGEFTGDTATIAEDMTIGGGSESDVYTISVNATVTADAWSNDTVQCQPSDNGWVAGGFRNGASAVVGEDEPITSTDCDEPGLPTVMKTVLPAQLQADGNWKVEYLVTVANTSGTPLFYDLSDTLDFPAGVEIVSAQVANDAGVDTTGWTGLEPDTALATAKSIGTATTHTYTISVIATVTQEISRDDLLCIDDGGTGHGFLNGAVMTSGTVPTEVAACTDIPVGILTLVKHVDNTPFDGLDLDGKTLAAASDWTLTAAGTSETFETVGAEEGTTRVVPAGEYALSEAVTDGVENPLVRYYSPGQWTCDAGDDATDTATVVPGEFATCEITNTGQPVDLTIEKLDGGEFDGGPAVPTNEGAEYDYTLTVTNNSADGTPATDAVVVSDEIPATLSVVSWTDVAGWTVTLEGEDAAGFGGTLTLTKDEPLATGDTVDFTFRVQTADVLPRENGDPTAKILDLVNTATVTSDGVEENPDDNTSTEITPVASVQVSAAGFCRADAPWLGYEVTPYNTQSVDPAPMVLIWWTNAAYAERDPSIPASNTAAILADGASRVDPIAIPAGWMPGTPISGEQLWPGAAVNAAGQAVAWPGWHQSPDGQWMLDPSAPGYDLRDDAVVEVRMNPSTGSVEAYPPAVPGCNPAPPSKMPVTGFDVGWIAGMAAGLMFAGAMFLLAYRLRRRPDDSSVA